MIVPAIHLNNREHDSHFGIFHELMAFKVREILLVSSAYDAFIMEEDGSLAMRIINEYQGLNLSSPPRITSVSTVEQAVGMFLNAETVVQNEDILNESIYSSSTGYISNYQPYKYFNSEGEGLVLAGTIGQILALFPLAKLLRELPKGTIRSQWRLLGLFIGLFITGYICYGITCSNTYSILEGFRSCDSLWRG